jgi:predicted ferric reductase
MHPFLLIISYLFVTLLPLILSATGGRPPRPLWDELASGAGMLAFAIILVEFVLSGRFSQVSRRIGMDVTMRAHQLFARTAFVLALVHPFLYRSPLNPQVPWDPTRQFTLTYEFVSIATGILAWVLLPTFVLMAVGREKLGYKYETWRLLHGVGALLIAGLILHHTMAAGRYSQDPILAAVWVALFLVAVLSLAYVYFIRPFWQSQRSWCVDSVRPIGQRTWELVIKPNGHKGLNYEAGQFVWLNIGNSPFSLCENPFSISSAPASGPNLEFIIKELGDFTRTIGQVKPGTSAYIDGPHGNLVLSGRKESGIALIGGGVGIAPLLGILRQLRLEGDARPTTLIYGNRVAEQISYGDELEALKRGHGTNVIHVLSEPPPAWTGPVGLVDAKLLQSTFPESQAKELLFILCGPNAMMETVEVALIELGVPAAQILSERFKYD